ncbi:MAG: nucleotide sugar dehydrogenase [Robiginitomaculum sp.]|nr:nucleotide sugar dehydrogenase [Robiginitomaculum sp.]MDQ7076449.1 nucleotide sugar dehydrogenase [Robiginitomaculum sp.]
MTVSETTKASVPLAALSEAFVRKVADKTLRIGVVGLGYVGLPLAEAFVRQSLTVVGFDIDQAKVDMLEGGKSYIKHISDDRIQTMNASGHFSSTTDFNGLKTVDAILICVPTPLGAHREPDLSYVVATTENIAQHVRPGQLIILESTTYPGTSEEVLQPILEAGGLKAGVDFAIAYSPEREDPGNPNFETSTIPKVVGASSEAEREMACALYGAIVPTVPVSNLRTAEAVKLTENIFRAVNIALVNELKVVFGAMDIDVWEVIEAAKTKPFGYMAFYPGPGLGGHCIPIDPFYLTWKARAYGLNTRFIELAGEINSNMPAHVVDRLAEAMNEKLGLAMKGAKALVVGLAYKKNVDDMRESPALELIDKLRARGMEVEYYDPYIPVAPSIREHPEVEGMVSATWTKEALAKFDVALIATDHDNVDYAPLLDAVNLVVDTRNAIKEKSDKVVRA